MTPEDPSLVCGLCGIVSDHRVLVKDIRLQYEYFANIDIKDELFTIVQCNNCGTATTLPLLSAGILNSYYNCNYAAHEQLNLEIKHSLPLLALLRNRITRPLISLFFKKSDTLTYLIKRVLTSPLFPRMFRGYPILVEEPKTLLDIGCGDGSFLYQIKEMPCASIGFEMAPNAVKIAQAAGLRVKQGVVDKLDESFVGQHFDVIRLIDILEHTTNPGSVIKQIHSLLNSNGECIICVPNYNAFSRRLLGKYWPVFHLPFHRFHFNYHSLKMILEKNGFVVKFCISKNTLQLLYGIEYFVHHKRIKIPIVNIFTRILFTPLDFFFDCCFPRWGDSIEIHAIRKS